MLVKEFGTERKAGWWVLTPATTDRWSGSVPSRDSDEFATLVRTGDDTRRVHTILRDQRTVAGIGRGYSDDVLHRGPSVALRHARVARAPTSASACSTPSDVLADGLSRRAEAEGRPAHQVGRPLDRARPSRRSLPGCGGDLRRVSYESHEVTYCPACQTGGKVLADRRMSRLLR